MLLTKDEVKTIMANKGKSTVSKQYASAMILKIEAELKKAEGGVKLTLAELKKEFPTMQTTEYIANSVYNKVREHFGKEKVTWTPGANDLKKYAVEVIVMK